MTTRASAPSPVATPIEEACYWLDRSRDAGRGAGLAGEEVAVLEGEHDADLAIVGGGFTGLWTALFAKSLEPSLRVVLLEREELAYGASGRNAGILSDTIDHSHALAIEHFGRQEATRLVALGRENLAEMLAFIEAHAVDCALEQTGVLTAAIAEHHLPALAAAVDCARSLGATDYQLLDEGAMRSEIHSELYRGAMWNPAGGVLDPVKLAQGLAREARRAGVAVFERSGVTSLEADGPLARVTTAKGTVRARRVVLGMSAYTHELVRRAAWRFLPLYDYVVASRPLTPEEAALIGWKNRQGVNDARSFFNYYRLTEDNRVVFGTSEAAYYAPNRVAPELDHSPRHYAELLASFRALFPALAELEFPYRWGGAICASTRFTPFFGRALGDRVVYGLGFTGHGLGTTHLAGKILAHLALERGTPLTELELVRSLPLPYPPEPLRGWAVRRVTSALRHVDAGGKPSLLLRCLDALGIGLSS